MQLGFLLGFERHAELELLVVHQTKAGRPHFRLRDVVHELHADVEVMEQEGLVHLFLGHRPHFDRDFRDDAEVALVAQDELMDVRT